MPWVVRPKSSSSLWGEVLWTYPTEAHVKMMVKLAGSDLFEAIYMDTECLYKTAVLLFSDVSATLGVMNSYWKVK